MLLWDRGVLTRVRWSGCRLSLSLSQVATEASRPPVSKMLRHTYSFQHSVPHLLLVSQLDSLLVMRTVNRRLVVDKEYAQSTIQDTPHSRALDRDRCADRAGQTYLCRQCSGNRQNIYREPCRLRGRYLTWPNVDLPHLPDRTGLVVPPSQHLKAASFPPAY